MEEWRKISIAESYEVSSLGRVRNASTGYVMKQQLLWDGYYRVSLWASPGVRVYKKTHQLVAAAFLNRPSAAHVAAHIDGSRTLNTVSNLYWATQKQNHADRDRHGRTARGSRNGSALLTEDQVRQIRKRLVTGDLLREIADDFSVCLATISNINTGKNWKHLQ